MDTHTHLPFTSLVGQLILIGLMPFALYHLMKICGKCLKKSNVGKFLDLNSTGVLLRLSVSVFFFESVFVPMFVFVSVFVYIFVSIFLFVFV